METLIPPITKNKTQPLRASGKRQFPMTTLTSQNAMAKTVITYNTTHHKAKLQVFVATHQKKLRLLPRM
jgi:hypothetical protein